MPERSPTTPGIPLFIGIAGGSGSGKTTIAEALVEHFDDEVALVQHDAYYRHTPELSLEERSRVNYDHPASLETELLLEHLTALRAGESIERPVYDFAKHLRSEQVVVIDPAPCIVVEGILVLAEPELRTELDLAVFVDTEPDLRLARRLERDTQERGRTVRSVIGQYLSTVRPMHLEFVEGCKEHADLVIYGGDAKPLVAPLAELIRSRAG